MGTKRITVLSLLLFSALYPLQSSGKMKTEVGPGDYKQAVAIGVGSSHADVAQDGGLFLQVPSKTLSERERNEWRRNHPQGNDCLFSPGSRFQPSRHRNIKFLAELKSFKAKRQSTLASEMFVVSGR